MEFLRFYIFMIIFFSACAGYDLMSGNITGFTFGWIFGVGYYGYRYFEVKQMLEDFHNDSED